MRLFAPVALALAGAVLLPLPLHVAAAQTGSPQLIVNPPPPLPPDPDPSHLFGDWGGLRTKLQNLGITLDLSYLGEMAADVAGGKRTGVDYAGQEEIKLILDWDKIAGLSGLTTHIALVNRNGRNLSADDVGDDLLQAQEIYGGGGDVVAHLGYAYNEEKFAGGTVDIKAGRLPVMTDFGSLSKGCDFMSLTICATRGLDANLGWTSFPRATWGGSIGYQLDKPFSIGTGVYEVSPDTGGSTGFDWSFGDSIGAIIPVELRWKPELGASKLPGAYKIGGYIDTAEFPEWNTAINGAPLYATALPAERTTRGGFYLLSQQMIWRKNSTSDQGITMLTGYVYNSPSTSLFEDFAFIGFLDKGLFAPRPKDQAGLEFTYARVSPDLTNAQQGEALFGEPLSFGAPGVQTHEMLIEANYDIAAYRGIHVMPDLQYVIRPSATSTYSNALVLGLQVKADF